MRAGPSDRRLRRSLFERVPRGVQEDLPVQLLYLQPRRRVLRAVRDLSGHRLRGVRVLRHRYTMAIAYVPVTVRIGDAKQNPINPQESMNQLYLSLGEKSCPLMTCNTPGVCTGAFLHREVLYNAVDCEVRSKISKAL